MKLVGKWKLVLKQTEMENELKVILTLRGENTTTVRNPFYELRILRMSGKLIII